MIEMAGVHEKLRDPEAALDLLERALSYRKDSVDLASKVSALRGKSLKKAIARADKAGDTAEADRLEGELRDLELGDLRARIELTPGDPNLRLELGKALLRQESHDEAASELQKALQDPRLASEARGLLARCWQEKGFLDLAKNEYTRALEGVPEAGERAREILYNLGAIAEAEGNLAEARSFYSRVFEVDIGYRDVAQKMEQLRGS